MREFIYLCKRKLILTDDNSTKLDWEGLAKISPAGRLHLRLLKNISYLAACAEDVNYRDIQLMTNISKRISSEAHLKKFTVYLTVKDMLDYLTNYQNQYPSIPEYILKDGCYLPRFNIRECYDALEQYLGNDSSLRTIANKITKWPEGTEVQCTIVSKKNQCLICTIEDDAKAFLATNDSQFNLSPEIYEAVEIGEVLSGIVVGYSNVHDSFQIKFNQIVPSNINDGI